MLATQARKEKLAHDRYAAFAARYEPVTFGRITAAEAQRCHTPRDGLGYW